VSLGHGLLRLAMVLLLCAAEFVEAVMKADVCLRLRDDHSIFSTFERKSHKSVNRNLTITHIFPRTFGHFDIASMQGYYFARPERQGSWFEYSERVPKAC